MRQSFGKYVLVTPARNEEKYISKTLDSVISQTTLPARWVIISDASIDRTDEIVRQYAERYNFIKLLRLEDDAQRSFGSKAIAFSKGCSLIEDIDYDFIGNLDADVEFSSGYFTRILTEFKQNPKLGVAGGVIIELVKGQWVASISGKHHVTGASQLFRRECFETIGGYVPVKVGGMDSIALIMARMNGWETRMIREEKIMHLKAHNVHFGKSMRVRFNAGRTDYNLGVSVPFALMKGLYRAFRESPYFLASLVQLTGYGTALLKGQERDVSPEVMHYYRQEQFDRFRSLFIAKERDGHKR